MRGVQELVGHQSLAMTQRYSHLSPAALDATIRLLVNRTTLRAVGDSVGDAKGDLRAVMRWLHASRRVAAHKEHEHETKDTICLWFNKGAEEAVRFYSAILPDSRVTAVRKAAGGHPGGK